MNPSPLLQSFGEAEVVLDVSSLYVYLGRLIGENEHYLILEDADVHDLRDTSTTRELYVLDARRHGVSVNRASVWVRKDEVVSLSRLEDVLV